MDADLANLLLSCFQVNPQNRPSPNVLMAHTIFKNVNPISSTEWKLFPSSFKLNQHDTSSLTLKETLQLWLMYGGSLEKELLKKGVVSVPALEKIPTVVRLQSGHDQKSSSHPLKQSMETFTVDLKPLLAAIDQSGHNCSFDDEWKRIGAWTFENIGKTLDLFSSKEKHKLFFETKERNIYYQKSRIVSFKKLLMAFPCSADEIRGEAIKDIPAVSFTIIWLHKGDIETYEIDSEGIYLGCFIKR